MAKKNRLKTVPETIVSILRDKKLNKTPDVTDLTFFRAFLDDTTRYVPTNIVALSTKGNKVYSLEEAKVLEQDIKNRGGVSIEEYILADTQKAIKFINASYAKNDISQKVRDEMLADVARNQNKWGIFSAMYTTIYGTVSENVTSEYVRAAAKLQPEAIIVFSNLPKIDTSTAKEIITSHYSALKYLPFRINKDFVPTAAGKLILLTDNKLIRTGYVIKVAGKYDDLSNIEHWKVTDIRGPLTDYVDQVTLADRKDIAHLIFAETGKQILGIKEAFSDAKGLLTDNEKDLLAILEELEQIAEASLEDAINTTSIVGGNIKNAIAAAGGIPRFTDPVVVGAKKGIKLVGGYAVVPVITEDKFVLKEGQAIISSEAKIVVDMLTDKKDTLFVGVPANAAYNQQTQRHGEVNSKKIIIKQAEKVFFNKGSLSIVASLLGQSVAKIFNTKEVLTQVNREKRKSVTKNKFNYRVGKAGKRVKHILPKYKYKNNILYKATSAANIKKQKIKGTPYQGTVNVPAGSANTELLSIINANLREEVIAKMKYPALVNDSGRFAGSVRVIDIINSQVSATFMKSPYSVFMQQGGKSPWNTKDRDPVKIINEAISSISSKYNLGISKVNIR